MNTNSNSNNNERLTRPIYDVPEPKIVSRVLMASVGLLCKFWLGFNTVTVHNGDLLTQQVEKTHKERNPLITVCNHISNLDDPICWGILPVNLICNASSARWTLGASNILFSNQLRSKFFELGKCIKIVRGDGIYQEGMTEVIDRLTEGQWLNIFPEGRVNQSGSLLYFKWGVGRMVAECFRKTGITPTVLPIYHNGLQHSMPLGQKAIPRPFQKLDIFVGETIDCEPTIKQFLFDNNLDNLDCLQGNEAKQKELYKNITTHIQDRFQSLESNSKNKLTLRERLEQHQHKIAGKNESPTFTSLLNQDDWRLLL
ncbi:hypothetical protein CYY_004615 [Polysphondylium violaceum]|uniref:Tafazzin family protein n=1 Tax=Polysphondylium violaceum TaxID=133409 RepID=A0A8J4USW5_9MYCE|nr:hypothetical protein CYY_004615 [Polysphondylium violaceum]